jgi:hypothetical protein
MMSAPIFKKMPPILTLHRYFIAANKMRILFDRTLGNPEFWKKYEGSDPMRFVYLMHTDDYGIFMFYWYGGLYVVIEGYRKLGLNNHRIDALLALLSCPVLPTCRSVGLLN